MKKEQLNLDQLSMIKTYFVPQQSKEDMLEKMLKSQFVMNGMDNLDYEKKILNECIDFIKSISNEEIQQLDFSEVLDEEEFIEFSE